MAQARALLAFLNEATTGQQTPYASQLRQELEALRQVPDEYIYHEHLEEHNAPIYFFEFEERLRRSRSSLPGRIAFPQHDAPKLARTDPQTLDRRRSRSDPDGAVP
jgi:hypothetical protein